VGGCELIYRIDDFGGFEALQMATSLALESFNLKVDISRQLMLGTLENRFITQDLGLSDECADKLKNVFFKSPYNFVLVFSENLKVALLKRFFGHYIVDYSELFKEFWEDFVVEFNKRLDFYVRLVNKEYAEYLEKKKAFFVVWLNIAGVGYCKIIARA